MINNFEKITSKQNTKIKWIRSLLSHRQERKNSNCYVLEGVRLIEEAHKANIIPELVLFSSNISTRGNQVLESFKSNTNEIYEVNYDLLRFISKTENPQGIIAVFNKTVLSIPEQADFLLIADGIRDPGNMGTLIRTSLAANVNALILTPGSVDIFSPKVLRSGMGGHLHLPIHTLEWEQIINIFKKGDDNGKRKNSKSDCFHIGLLIFFLSGV